MIILIWQTKTFASYLTEYRITIFIHSLIFKEGGTIGVCLFCCKIKATVLFWPTM
jgi:hypothetical protein